MTIAVSGAGFGKEQKFTLPAKTRLSAVSKAVGARTTVTLKAIAPDKPVAAPGLAVIDYPMQDAADEFQTRFGLDIGIGEGDYGQQ